uniref:dTDP-4-dehydrorhamnose reductase n=1 Tax=Polaribacter sp. TaxID=1920175 RepID=UPI0040484759
MKKRVVITGSNGLLGQTLVNLLLEEPNSYEVTGFSKGPNRSKRIDFKYVSLDITDQKSLKTQLKLIRPHFIVNTAAMTNVDACESNRDACYALNVSAVGYLTDISKSIGAHLIHLSTDFIFDGIQGNYKETDAANPLSYYGETKLLSEEILNNSAIDFTILRTILVYGLTADMSRSNIVLWVKESLEQHREIQIVNDQYRTPTFVLSLAEACKRCIDISAKGTFHIASNTLLSIYEIALQIADTFGLDAQYIKPIETATLNQPANRPAKTGFDLTKTKNELNFHPKSFKEDLQKFKDMLT